MTLDNLFLCKIKKCLPLYIIQFQVAFLDAAADCVEWQWFSKVLPSPCGYVHHGSMDGFSNNTAWGLDGHAHSAAVTALGLLAPRFPLTPWIFSQYIWTVDGERPKFFAILRWETLSLNWLTIFSQSLAQSGEPMTHPCLQRLSLSVDAPFILNLDNLTCYQLNC